jgi:N-acyl homoserine lactone hydrolase
VAKVFFGDRHNSQGALTVKLLSIIAALLTLPLLTQLAAAEGKAERLYVIECGSRTAPDVSLWTPGINVGQPIDFVDTCYVIKHRNDWMFWDTGLPDAIFAAPLTDPFAWRRTNTLAGELDKIGIKPNEVKFLAVSHSHPDHIGNVELFPQAMLLVQQAEYDWPNQNGSPRFTPSHPVTKLQGDYDVFGDGSVTILSTPGHTPGHQSLLVRLPQTGAVLLSGDAVHLKDNWDAKRVPAINVDKEKSSASMQRMSEVIAENKAQLWINHDKPQSETMKHVPEYYQ